MMGINVSKSDALIPQNNVSGACGTNQVHARLYALRSDDHDVVSSVELSSFDVDAILSNRHP